jgi:hypothetical protein
MHESHPCPRTRPRRLVSHPPPRRPPGRTGFGPVLSAAFRLSAPRIFPSDSERLPSPIPCRSRARRGRPADTRTDTQNGRNGYPSKGFVGIVESRKSLRCVFYGAGNEKARPPTRGPGTARENDACSWTIRGPLRGGPVGDSGSRSGPLVFVRTGLLLMGAV